jgi:hypothetical protein
MNGTWMNRLRQVDQRRASFPGEHWLVATAGMWLLRRRGLLGKVAGAALLYRAASGRDGLLGMLRGGSARGNAQGRFMNDGRGGRQWETRGSDGRGSPAGGRSGSGVQYQDGFPERGAGSNYEARGNPAVSGYPDFR